MTAILTWTVVDVVVIKSCTLGYTHGIVRRAHDNAYTIVIIGPVTTDQEIRIIVGIASVWELQL